MSVKKCQNEMCSDFNGLWLQFTLFYTILHYFYSDGSLGVKSVKCL